MRRAAALALLLAAACGYDPGGRCETSVDCLERQVCSGGLCRVAGTTDENAAPVAAPDTCSVPSGATAECTVLANDADPDGDALVAEVATAPGHGRLLTSELGFVYVPDPGYSGADSFTYRASDGALRSAPAAVTLAVTPAAP